MQTASSLLVLTVFLVSVKGCPSGWLRHEDKCYHFSHDTETWLGAIDMCKLLGGKIVEIETATENAYLAANAKLQNKWYWIGLSDVQEESVWIWIGSRQKLADVGFKHWDVNEPSNSGSDENCAILRTNGFWNDYRCVMPGHYICETDNDGTEIVG